MDTQTDSPPRDEGSATLFVVVLAAALLATAGLVVDGGYALAARQEAAATAEQAARAGADALARDDLRSAGPLRLDPAAATAAAQSYLASTGHLGKATVSGQSVTVSVRITRRTAILSAVGIDTVSSAATATAVGLTGIDRPDPALTGAAYRAGAVPTDPEREAAR
ncbi:MAG: pilus assembly protein TadG-related protein [Sporichthyaceae bacterium]